MMKALPGMASGLALLYCAPAVAAPAIDEWAVVKDDQSGALIATIGNAQGYTLEVYRDPGAAVRSRFTLPAGLLSFHARACPSFQIDNGPAQNRSVDDASCLAGGRWAEYILAYPGDERIDPALLPSALPALAAGAKIRYRFRLANGDYRETGFSLAGAGRALAEAVGEQALPAKP